MITDLWIENFKGISKRQHIPLRPVTLLVGANSAGKSTVFHALIYLQHVLQSESAVPPTELGGPGTVNLGSFSDLVHGCAKRRARNFQIAIGFRIARSEWTGEKEWADSKQAQSPGLDSPSHVKYIDAIMSDTDVRLTTVFTKCLKTSQPQLASVRIDVDGTPFFCTTLDDTNTGAPLDDAIAPVAWIGPAWIERLLNIDGHVASQRRSVRIRQESFIETTGDHFSQGFLVHDILDLPMPPVAVGASEWRQSTADFLQANGHCSWSKLALVSLDDFEGFLAENEDSIHQDGEADSRAESGEFASEDCGSSRTALVVLAIEEEAPEYCQARPVALLFPKTEEHWVSVLTDFRFDFFSNTAVVDHPIRVDFDSWPMGSPLNYDRSSSLLCQLHEDTELQAMVDGIGAVAAHIVNESRNLFSIRYIGPKRATPPRLDSVEVSRMKMDWGSGLAAWQWLLANDETDTNAVSEWLSSPDLLNTGFSIQRNVTVEVPEAYIQNWISDSIEGRVTAANVIDQIRFDGNCRHRTYLLITDLRSGAKLHPHNVGEGLTQIIPIIVAVVSSRRGGGPSMNGLGILAFEQPELHLHPYCAARLADLFLQRTRASRGIIDMETGTVQCGEVVGYSEANDLCLVETHSEHLILRILRRIRQTTNAELPKHVPPVKADDVCVLWVANLGDGTTFQRLRIDDQGEFIDRWPRGFFSERAEELF